MRFLFVLISLFFSVSLTFAADESVLCDQVFQDQISFSDRVETPASSETLTLITWNMQKFENSAAFADVKKLTETADIIFLQEALHSDGWQKAFASHIPYSWNFFKSWCTDTKRATGVQSGSRYPLLNNQNLISPVSEPITFTPKVTGFSQIEVPGHGTVTLVNTHALNFNSGADFKIQIKAIIEKLKLIQGPMIWAGDFNTWTNDRLQFLLQTTAQLGLTHLTPTKDTRGLVLDHIFVRGLTVISSEVLPEKTSDHRPLKAVFRF